MRPVYKAIGLTALVALFAVMALTACGGDEGADGEGSPAADKSYSIGITQIVTHPALDACVEGFKEAMAEKGYTEGDNVTYDVQNAQGDMADRLEHRAEVRQRRARPRARHRHPDQPGDGQGRHRRRRSCSPPSPIRSAPASWTTPTRPAPTSRASATCCRCEPHLDLIKKIAPDAKTIGVLYNAGEANSVFLVEAEKEAATAMGLKIVEATASNSSEVQAAAEVARRPMSTPSRCSPTTPSSRPSRAVDQGLPARTRSRSSRATPTA